MIEIVIGIITVVYLAGSMLILRRLRLDTRTLCVVGIFTAMALILRCIRIPLPTGSSIALLSVLPTMILAILYGAPVGMISGILTGVMAMFFVPGYQLVHPMQLIVEHIAAIMGLGLAGLFGYNSRPKLLMACGIAIFINVLFHTFSGILFFSQNAPLGQSAILYSAIYNCSSHGVEGLLGIMLIACLPFKGIIKVIGVR